MSDAFPIAAWAQTIAEGLLIQQQHARERQWAEADARNVGLQQARSLPTVALMALWDSDNCRFMAIDCDVVYRVMNERGFGGYVAV